MFETIELDSASLALTEMPLPEDKGQSEMQNLQPSTIVLQPNGVLDRGRSHLFQQTLEEALEAVCEGVIVDLLWVESISTFGVNALIAGIKRAIELGKLLSFQSLDSSTRHALEAEWIRQRDLRFGTWNDLFEKDLEQFLEHAPLSFRQS
jgi:anti-anti-sigma regulatory factor